MIAETPLTITTSPGRARCAEIRRRAANDADPGGVDEQLVGGAALHDLGVAGHDGDAGLAGDALAIERATRRRISTSSPSSRSRCRKGTAAARRQRRDR